MKLSRVTCFIYYLGSTVFRALGGRVVRVFFQEHVPTLREIVVASRVSEGGWVRIGSQGVVSGRSGGVRRENREAGRKAGDGRRTDNG